jgi:hypothetical protein
LAAVASSARRRARRWPAIPPNAFGIAFDLAPFVPVVPIVAMILGSVVLVLITALIAALAFRTIIAMRRGQLFPPRPAQVPAQKRAEPAETAGQRRHLRRQDRSVD